MSKMTNDALRAQYVDFITKLLVDGGEEYSEEQIGKVSRWEPYNSGVSKGTKITVWISKGLDEATGEVDDTELNNQ